MKDFFFTLPKHFLTSFAGKRIWLHLAAIALTYALLATGFDWWWFVHTSRASFEPFFFPAVILGGLLPILIPLGLLALGALQHSAKRIMTGWALGQAALLGLLISSLYKAFTGRIPPVRGNIVADISHGFQLGFLRHGVFWGWPSSHTTVAFALAVAFCVMYPKQRLASALALLAALYVGLGVSMSIHWFSEFAAGILIGTAVGLTVGAYFHQYTSR